MKVILSMVVISIVLLNSFYADGQVASSLYNVNRNDQGKYDYENNSKHNRTGKIILASGLLVGGLVLGTMADHQDYYVSNTTIYGLGGIMTLLATGLIIGSVNCLNKEIKISYTGNAVGINFCLDSGHQQRKKSF